jgi:hypothetical protein
MSNQYGPKIITDNLVFCVDAANPRSYPGSGDKWYDLVNNNVGHIGNSQVHAIATYNSSYAPIFTSDSGGSFLFDGVNDHVVFPDSTSLRYMGSNMSLFAWAKPTINITTARNIVARRNGSNIGGYIHHNGNYNNLTVYIFSNSWKAVSTQNIFVPNVWCYTGFTWDGTSLKTYKNGVLVGNVSPGGGAINPIESTMRIGSSGLTSQPWAGHISNVQIYNSTLTNNQILQNYNALKGRFGLS